MTPERLHKSYRIATQNQKWLPYGYLKSKMDTKIQVQAISIASILYFVLLLVALYILLIGPIREILRDETVFTESYQITNGKNTGTAK